MACGLLRPLVVFCTRSESQRYIKSIRNLGDAWRSLDEKPHPESDKDSVWVETTFDFVLKVTSTLAEEQPKVTIVEMSTYEPPISPIFNNQSTPTTQMELPRHYRICADYGTDFIWRDPDDIRPEEGCSVLEPEEVLSAFTHSFLGLYDVWVDTFADSFKERREKPGNYRASTFPTASEEVA